MGNLCSVKAPKKESYQEEIPVISIKNKKGNRPLSAASRINQDLDAKPNVPLYMVK